jgi:Ca2+-binding RTX toxin-like protein
MLEKIEVGYTPAAGVGALGIFHKYILYTDSSGNEFYARGGPGYIGPGASDGGLDESSTSPFGNIKTKDGAYTNKTPDWDFARDPNNTNPDLKPHPRELISEGADLGSAWERIKDAMRDIDNRDVPYDPTASNSNASVDEALRRSGLPSPKEDTPDKNWAPGSDYDMPGGDVSPNGEVFPGGRSFGEEVKEWVRLNLMPEGGNEGLLGSWEAEGWSDFLNQWTDAQNTTSPLILDLDGDNVVETVAKSEGQHFDHSADGFAETTGWAGKDDGFLVRDLNQNGTIDTGRELFGNQTLRTDGTLAANGFEALRDLDSNGDGQITSLDGAFAELRVWKDTDGDAQTDAGELLTLTQAGVQSISVGYTDQAAQQGEASTTDTQGNQHRQVGSYTTTTGATRGATDVWFDLNLWDTTDQRAPLSITPVIAALPELMGSGTLGSLHQAMARDSSGQLTAAVGAYIHSSSTSATERDALVQEVLYRWAGVYEQDPASRGYWMGDGRKLGVLEAVFGQSYLQNNYWTNPGGNAAPILLDLFNDVAVRLAAQLDAQAQDRPLYDAIGLVWNEPTQSFALDAAAVESLIRQTYALNPQQALDDLGRFGRNLRALGTTAVLDALVAAGNPQGDEVDQLLLYAGSTWGSQGDDALGPDSTNEINGARYLFGWGGNDTLDGGAGDDVIHGGDGNDTITDAVGANTLKGGAGNDIINGSGTMEGGTGDDVLLALQYGSIDTYVFNLGDGKDSITDLGVSTAYYGAESADTLRFGAGISPSAVSLSRSGNDLVFKVSSTDQVTVKDWYVVEYWHSRQYIENVQFADGTLWTLDTLLSTPIASVGTATADTINGWEGKDVIEGYGGDDSLDGGYGDDIINGGDGNDTLTDLYGANTLKGGAGSDTITGVGTMEGGTGDDVITAGNFYSADTYVFNLGDGKDSINDYGYPDLYGDPQYADTLKFGAGIAASAVALSRSGNDLVFKVSATDQVSVKDWYVAREWNDYGDHHIENVQFADGTLWTLDTLRNMPIASLGTANADTIFGWEGKDVIDGGAGADTMQGGAGDDTYVVDNTADRVTENANEGIDTVRSSIAYTLGADVENLTLTGTAAVNGTGNELNNIITGNSAANTLDGGAGTDTLDGGAGADTMRGGLGDDSYVVDSAGDVVSETSTLASEIDIVTASVSYTLTTNVENLTLTGTAAINGSGNALSNVLTGNSAANVLTGGAGNDTYVVGTGDTTIEVAGGGIDTVQSAITWTLAANLEHLSLTGTTAINGTGNSLANTLIGNSAANVLDGGTSADTLTGGLGNDTYVVDNAGDVVSETSSLASEIDTVNASVTYALAANVENLTLTGTAAINGTGNELNNVLTGNSAANTLTGGAGNDTYVVGTGDTTMEVAGDGIDTVQSAITWTLAAELENLTLTGTAAINGTGNELSNLLIGNSAANTLTGGAGSDTLDGGIGADTLLGGTGDDIYVVDNTADVVTENANEGSDTVQSAITWTLAANIENLTLTGTNAINGSGNELNNVLIGNSAANTLTGGAGSDTLDGGAGADTLTGGTGDDTYGVDNAADVVAEHANEGLDTVQSAITYTLGATLENLTLTGTAAINGSGNSANNVLTGNSAANTLTGGAGHDTLNGGDGADTLTGGTGDDTYVVDNAGDRVTENANEGSDTVQSAITWTLAANIENLTLTGTNAINGTGNELNNVLTGNAGNNILNGGVGADTLQGGLGNDTYVLDNAADVVSENANEGTDTVQVGFAYTLGANLESLSLTGTAAINGTGNELNNVLTGNSAANTLTGGAGSDTLNGGAGADTLIGGTGDDTYVLDNVADVAVENASEGTDTVKAGFAYTLGATLENLTLTGTAAINGTGNAANNVLTGNSAANTLSGGAGSDIYVVQTRLKPYLDDVGKSIATKNAAACASIAWARSRFDTQACSNSATVTPRASAIFSTLSSDILRTCRSTWAMKVRCKSASKAKSSCDQARTCRSLTMFTANMSRAQRRLRAGFAGGLADVRGIGL